jgi:dienelactone hydrolase
MYSNCIMKANELPCGQNSIRLKSLVLTITFLFTVFGNSFAQDQLNVIRGNSSNNHWIHFSDAPNALYHHLTAEAYELLEKRNRSVAGLQSTGQWQQWQEDVRQILQDILGPFPGKTPLNPQTTRTIGRDGYHIEHIIFESQPEFYVTSSLYIPGGLNEPAPAVLYVSGHTQDGYRAETYQHKILNLVHKGFIVFAIDPVGQGERLEYFDPETESSIVGGPTREHSYAGVQAFLTGQSLAGMMTWDGIRAVDYLLTREEVDPDRIGITGRSGGGTQTAYIAAMDDRIYAAAPEAYITNFTRLLQSIGPQDAEQNLPSGIMRGIDHADFLTVRAPKPLLIIATTEDFFSIQGMRESAAEVNSIYEAYDATGNFEVAEDAGGHQSTQKNREAMYAFFQKHLDNPGDPDDLEVDIPSDEDLRVTETGQISTTLNSQTVFSLNRKIAEEMNERLIELRRDPGNHFPGIAETAKKLSGFKNPQSIPDPIFTGRIIRNGYSIEKYFMQGEGNYVIPYLLFKPEQPNGKAVVYLHPEGKSAITESEEILDLLIVSGLTVLAPDLVGTGEMSGGDLINYPATIKDFGQVSFDAWIASVLTGRSITGIQAADMVRLARYLDKQPDVDEIYGIAIKSMSPILLHASVIEPSIDRVALIKPYSSYRSLVMQRYYDPGFHLSTVAGSIGKYDLPDLAAALAPRRLLMAGVTDASGAFNNPDIQPDINIIQSEYERNEADQNLVITTDDPSDGIIELLKNWLVFCQ